MKPKEIKENKSFVGRDYELERLKEIGNRKESSIIVTYGRRRVGKTELMEQAFRKRNIVKFEGIEGLPERAQMGRVMDQLSVYTQEPLHAKIAIKSWSEFFMLLDGQLKKGVWTLYFEEVQWLANYKETFISELKFAWDNYFRHNPNLILILCGSSPSFMINKVLHSRALYNRSQHEFPLKEFTLPETLCFLKRRSPREATDAYLTVGGIPEYLKWINMESSIFLGLCKHSFVSGGFFSHEYERIFTSSMAGNRNYKKIIEYLSLRRYATRSQLLKNLKIESGGTLSSLLQDLATCGFVEKYAPYNLKENSLLARYAITDAYLQFYFKFIKPHANSIDNGDYNTEPATKLHAETLDKWLGFAFERLCRKNHRLISKILGFESVRYKSGAFFNRLTGAQNPGYQIDLVFDRADNVHTVCEIKYSRSPVSSKVIEEFEKKLSLFPNHGKKSIQRVLISAAGAGRSLLNNGYMDRIITLDDMFDSRYW